MAIARAIVTAPAAVLADEPTGNLDTQRSHEIMGLLLALNRDHGITVLMVTHEPDMAAYARRMVTFVDGSIARDVPNANPTLVAPADLAASASPVGATRCCSPFSCWPCARCGATCCARF